MELSCTVHFMRVLSGLPPSHPLSFVLIFERFRSSVDLLIISSWRCGFEGEFGRSGVHGGAPRTGRQDASDDHL